jgi:NAD-dependent SIR2 family protein deacetylase
MDQPIDHYVFVLSLRCVECHERWDDESERWRVYFTSDQPPKPVTYCPDCARREFGD